MLLSKPDQSAPSLGNDTAATQASLGLTELLIAAVMLAIILGMRHDFRSTSANEGKSVEEGAGIEGEAEFEQDVSVAYPERKLAFVLTAALGLYCVSTARRWFPPRIDPVMLLTVGLLLWVGATMLWSKDRGETGRELIRVGVYTFAVFALAMRFSPISICRIIVLSLSGSFAIACVWELAGGSFHPTGSDYRLTGSLHPNSLSRHALIAGIGATAFWAAGGEHRKKWLIILVAAVVVILLTKSRTSLATFLCGVGMVFFAGRPVRRLVLPAALACTVLAAGCLAFAVGGRAINKRAANITSLGREDQSSALTGRLPLWSLLMKESAGRHLQGAGFGAFWNVRQTERVGDKLLWYPRHAHSAYVETVLNIGVIGLAITLVLALTTLSKSFWLVNATGAVEYRIFAGIVTAGLINGLAEAAFVMPRDLAIFTGLAVVSVGYASTSPAYAAVTPRAGPPPQRRPAPAAYA
ncbi:MAG: O-antigen ligase family protein [Planctomycetota bacterium]